MQRVQVGDFYIGDGAPLALMAGPCVIENEAVVLKTAEQVKEITTKRKIPYIFKSSFLKDNRSNSDSYRGPGLEKGLRILQKVKDEFDLPLVSDIHHAQDAEACAEVLDVIQIPAFLSMQTSLLEAVGRTRRVVNVKKGQFLAGSDMASVIAKVESTGNKKILLTDRGTMFGYNNLVLDIRNLKIMRELGYPVVLDPTHAIRKFGVRSAKSSGGIKDFIFSLSRAGVAAGVDALFIETHPDCQNALCDADSMLPLQRLDDLLAQLTAIDALIKPHVADDEKGMY